MSDRTKLILAITLGSLGLVIGVFATIVAYNAKNAVTSNEEVTKLVDQRFDAAQARQDALDKQQASDAEKLVAGLDKGKKDLAGKINSNTRAIGSLQSQVGSLNKKYKSLSGQVADLDNQEQKDFDSLNTRIDKTNQRISNSGGG